MGYSHNKKLIFKGLKYFLSTRKPEKYNTITPNSGRPIYLTPQCEKVVLNVNGDILDDHFGNGSGVPVEPVNPKPGDKGDTNGVDGFEAKESEWGEIAFTPWSD